MSINLFSHIFTLAVVEHGLALLACVVTVAALWRAKTPKQFRAAVALVAACIGLCAFQGFNQGPTNFVGNNSFTGSNSLPHISNENGIIAVDGTTYATPQAAITACLAATSCGEVYVPAGLYTSSSLINCSAASGHFLRIRGAGMDSSFGTILRFTGATDGLQLNANCTAEDLNIDTSNASGGIGLRFSGLIQYIRNIQVTASGSGAWAKQIQALGPVTGKLQTSYTTSTGGPIGLDIICNGVCPSGATGALELDGDEFRSSGTGVHLNGALSVVMFGGSVESNTTNGILADTNASQLAIYGTHMEQNGTNDISWLTGGHLSIFETIHPGGTTNILNCPNTTCTAQIRIYGLISQNTAANLILGNAVTNGTLYGSNIAGSHLTIGKPSAVCVLGNTSLDSTAIPNTVCYDGTESRWTFQYPTGPTSGYVDVTNTRMLFSFNGVNAAQFDGSGNYTQLAGTIKTGQALAIQLTAGGQAIRGSGVAGDNNFLDLGNVTFRNSDAGTGGSVTIPAFKSSTNCQLGGAAGTTSPAACSAAPAGMIAIPTSLTSYTINTTAVTANSEIFLQQMTDSGGLPSAPTCNATLSNPLVSSHSAGSGFTFSLTSVAGVTCYKYWIIN